MRNSESIEPATVDLIYEITREGLPNQLQEMSSLDAKLVQVFGAASVVLGLASVAAVDKSDTRMALLIAAVGGYIICALAVLVGVWTRRVKRPFHSDTLLDDYWQNSAAEVKYALADELPEIYNHNQGIIDCKALVIRIAIMATAIEVALVGAMVIWAA